MFEPLQWLKLASSRAISPRLAHELSRHLTSPLSTAEIGSFGKVLKILDSPINDSVKKWLDWESRGQGTLLTPAHPDFPPLLLEIPDPPLLLFATGRLALMKMPALAIVGTRNPGHQGKEDAKGLAACLCKAGLTIVSGLALGIDAAAHWGALESGSTQSGTIAVLGAGIDVTYPAANADLMERIRHEGLLLSEQGPGIQPKRYHFPRRNRVIAGLSRGTLVIEAGIPSGALITARLANEYNREVFAIPGSIHNPMARGCHALLKQGAILVENAADILKEWVPSNAQGDLLQTQKVKGDSAAEGVTGSVLQAVDWNPLSLVSIAARVGLPAELVASELIRLVLEGAIVETSSGFQRAVRL